MTNKETLNEMQNIQQQLQVLLMQKQNISMQVNEIKTALDEVKKTTSDDLFEIVGTVMLKRKKTELETSLKEKQEFLDLRLSSIEKQITKLTERSKELQKELLTDAGKKKSK